MATARSHLHTARLDPPRRAPGKRYPTPIHFFVAARRDPLAMLSWARREYGDVVRFDSWPLTIHLLYHPEHIKHVLQENNRNYWKGSLIGRVKPLIGEGLFTSEGDFWRRQRRLAQPAFHRQRIEGLATVMSQAGAHMLEELEPAMRSGAAIDFMEHMSRVTLRIVGQALFGIDLLGEAGSVGRNMLSALQFVSEEVFSLLPSVLLIPTPRNLRFRRARGELDAVVLGIIAERRRHGGGDDLLRMLMEARDADTGEMMSDRQLRDEVMTFVLAGHETTAVTLAWACFLVAQHPDVADALRREVSDVLGGRRPRLADLGQLALTRRVIDETLRLYPPVAAISRESYAADEIAGYRIPPKTGVMMSAYVTHRHPAFWSDPERFDPNRFTPDNSVARPRFAYFPFGGGPRLCIGNEFALMEAQILLAMLMQRFRVELVPDHPVEHEIRITLRPKQPMRMIIRQV